MTYRDVLKDLKARKYAPVYLLQGEEEYYIDRVSDYIEQQVLSEAERSFNQTIFYGKDTDTVTIANTAKRYPMMSDYQVILVKEAQSLKKWDDMLSYIEHPLSSTILVFCYKYGKLDKRLKVGKAIAKSGVVMDSKKLYENQVPAWISEYLLSGGFRITPKASALIAEYLGNDLAKIAGELDKLVLNLPADTEIGVRHIEENIGISKDFNVFELNSALAKKDVLKANRIIGYFAANPRKHPMVMVIGALCGFFTKVLVYHSLKNPSRQAVASALKVNPFFTGEYELAARNYPLPRLAFIISQLRQYDLRSKGVDSTGNVTEGELMKELVFKILH